MCANSIEWLDAFNWFPVLKREIVKQLPAKPPRVSMHTVANPSGNARLDFFPIYLENPCHQAVANGEPMRPRKSLHFLHKP